MEKINGTAEIVNGQIVVTRSYGAPRERVWRMWTDPLKLAQWWGPKNNILRVQVHELRVDGRFLFCEDSPEGHQVWTTGAYQEIRPFDHLAFTFSFADPQGNAIPASTYGFEAGSPLEMLISADFEDAGPGRTHMTVRQSQYPGGEWGEMAIAGWGESLEKFESALFEKAG